MDVHQNETEYVENAIINAIVVGSVRRAIINVVMLVEGGHPEKNEAEVPTHHLPILVWEMDLVFQIHIMLIQDLVEVEHHPVKKAAIIQLW